jgi:tetratricopeptide (TPR) repeat protein
MSDRDERPPGAAPPSNVLSITRALEKKAWERLELQGKHRRAHENLIRSASLGRELASIDFDPLLAQVDPASEACAELRCGRAMQRCLRGDAEGGLAEWAAVATAWPALATPYVMRGRWLGKTDPHAALADLDRAAQLDPTQPTIYFARGQVYREQKDPDRALANYRRAVALDPRSVDAQHELAELLAELGDDAGAVAAYGRAIALAPGYVDLHRGRAWSLEATGKWEAAIGDYDRILELTPEDHDARFCRALCVHRTGRAREAAAELALTASAAPDDAIRHRSLGIARLDAGDAAGAVAALTRAIELEPGHPAAHSFRGRAHAAAGDRASALADLGRAATLEPDSATVALELFFARAPTLAPDAAEAAIDRLAASFPGDWMVAHLQASHHTRGATPEEAIVMWDRVVAMDPPAAEPYMERAKAHAKAGHVQSAYDDAARAIERAPDQAWSYTARAIYGSNLDHEEAVVTRDFDRAAELAPDDLFALYHRGMWRSELGEFAGAVLDLDRAIAIAPSFGDLYFERASCRARIVPEDDATVTEEEQTAMLDACVRDLETALELGCKDEGVFLELFYTYRERHDPDAAASALERGMEAAPEFAALYYFRSTLRDQAGDADGAAKDRARALELGWRMGED